MKLFTWGYQSRSFTDLLSFCRKENIRTVVDVRRYAASSQPGWGLASLRGELEESGLNYVHIPGLGNYGKGLPWNRSDVMTVSASINRVVAYMRIGHVLLLCRERNPEECHRLEVAQEVEKACCCDVVHLGAPKNRVVDCKQISLFPV